MRNINELYPQFNQPDLPFRTRFVSELAAQQYFTTRDRNQRLVGGARNTRIEEDNFWTVYIAGVYEFCLQAADNDPDPEYPGLGWTELTPEPEWSIVPMEVIRDVAAQLRAGQPQWTPQQTAAVQRILAVHEIGHQFELPDDKEGFPQHVMSIHSGDAQEWQVPQLPTTFRPEDIVRIRLIGTGTRPEDRRP